ncbi:MAG: PucR family transcriptional regulator [Solirubrobacteraceae bacterium]
MTDLLRDAAEHGVAAVALAGNPDTVRDVTPHDAAVAVFAVEPNASWAHVHTVAQELAGRRTMAREMLAPHQDLFAVANAVAERVGGAVTIEDVDSTLLAFSTPQGHVDQERLATILGRSTPIEAARWLRHAGVFRRLAESDEPVLLTSFHEEGLNARMGIAIKAGDQVLGYLWATESKHPLSEHAAAVLKDYGPVIAMHLLQTIASGTAERTRRWRLAASALDGTWTADHTAELQLRSGERVAVVCLAPDADTDADERELDLAYLCERACHLIEGHTSTYRVRAMATRRGARVYCILPTGDRRGTQYVRTETDQMLRKLTVSLRTPFRAGTGGAVTPHSLSVSRREAEVALRTGQELNLNERAKQIDEVRDLALVVALRDVGDLQPLVERGSVARVRAHDHRHQTAYEQSMRAFLDFHCSIPAAAKALDVHPNTMRYRLTKLAETFSIDLGDPQERLALSLQLWLLPAAAPLETAPE